MDPPLHNTLQQRLELIAGELASATADQAASAAEADNLRQQLASATVDISALQHRTHVQTVESRAADLRIQELERSVRQIQTALATEQARVAQLQQVLTFVSPGDLSTARRLASGGPESSEDEW